jgi:hypothetical protein
MSEIFSNRPSNVGASAAPEYHRNAHSTVKPFWSHAAEILKINGLVTTASMNLQTVLKIAQKRILPIIVWNDQRHDGSVVSGAQWSTSLTPLFRRASE